MMSKSVKTIYSHTIRMEILTIEFYRSALKCALKFRLEHSYTKPCIQTVYFVLLFFFSLVLLLRYVVLCRVPKAHEHYKCKKIPNTIHSNVKNRPLLVLVFDEVSI